MNIFKEGMRFIEQEPALDSEQKQALLQEVRRAKSPTQVLRWIWTCLTFRRPDFGSRTILEKEETLKGLIQGLTKGPRQGDFFKILEIFFPTNRNIPKGIDLEDFFTLLTERVRQETQLRFKTRLVEIMVRFSKTPPARVQPEDLMPGLYHPDITIRCRCLLFIYKHFRTEGLRAVIRAIKTQSPPHSLFFCETLRSLITQDQEIYHEIKQGILDLNALWLLLRAKPEPGEEAFPFNHKVRGWDLRLRLDLITGHDNPLPKHFHPGPPAPPVGKPKGNWLRKERLELIGIRPERRT